MRINYLAKKLSFILVAILCSSYCYSSNNKKNDLIQEKMTSLDFYQGTPESKVEKDTTINGIRIIEYKPVGVCSKHIHIEVDKDKIIQKVEFTKGCSGNTQGVAALIRGMKVGEAIKRLEGIKCGNKETSCPDQLARALRYLLK